MSSVPVLKDFFDEDDIFQFQISNDTGSTDDTINLIRDQISKGCSEQSWIVLKFKERRMKHRAQS